MKHDDSLLEGDFISGPAGLGFIVGLAYAEASLKSSIFLFEPLNVAVTNLSSIASCYRNGNVETQTMQTADCAD